MSAEYLVGIDSGTQSVRAAVYDSQGNLLASARQTHAPLLHPQSGRYEHDPHDLWAKCCLACQEALQGINPADLAGVCLTTQRAVFLPVDGHGTALQNAISWMDQRSLSAEETGNEAFSASLYNRAAWLKKYSPEIHQKSSSFLSASGWLTYNLCGQFHDSPGSLGPVFPLDIQTLEWSSEENAYRTSGMQRKQLPVLFSPGTKLGHVSRQGATASGLPAGLPLIAGSGDKCCEVLGAGVTGRNDGYLSYGSLVSLISASDHYPRVDAAPVWLSPGWKNRHWMLEYPVEPGYQLVSWLVERLRNTAAGTKTEQEILQKLTEIAGLLPGGCDGLTIRPNFGRNSRSNGCPTVFGWDEKIHNTAHLFRAILEGVAREVDQGKLILEGLIGAQFKRILLGGGGAANQLAAQISADMIGVPLSPVTSRDSGTRGAAILAAVGCGMYPDVETAVEKMVPHEPAGEFIPARTVERNHRQDELNGFSLDHFFETTAIQLPEGI